MLTRLNDPLVQLFYHTKYTKNSVTFARYTSVPRRGRGKGREGEGEGVGEGAPLLTRDLPLDRGKGEVSCLEQSNNTFSIEGYLSEIDSS